MKKRKLKTDFRLQMVPHVFSKISTIGTKQEAAKILFKHHYSEAQI